MTEDNPHQFVIGSALSLKVHLENESEFIDALQDAIDDNPEMGPYAVVFDQPYAEYQEFGTGPYSGSHPSHLRTPGLSRKSKYGITSHDSFGHTEAQQRFIEWAKIRATKDYMKLARAAYHHVMKYGLDKNKVVTSEYAGFHPFIRPAYYEMLEKAKDPDAFETVLELAEATRDRAIEIMTENDWVASGLLRDSIECRPLSADEAMEYNLYNEGDYEDKQ